MKNVSIHSTLLVINKLQAHCIKMNFIKNLCKIYLKLFLWVRIGAYLVVPGLGATMGVAAIAHYSMVIQNTE